MFIRKTVAIVLIALLISGCTQPERAERVLVENGYTDVKIEGYAFFGCDEKDVFRTQFKAVAASGKLVSGTVCSGWFKGATIRFD
jgi:hypothetical protein